MVEFAQRFKLAQQTILEDKGSHALDLVGEAGDMAEKINAGGVRIGGSQRAQLLHGLVAVQKSAGAAGRSPIAGDLTGLIDRQRVTVGIDQGAQIEKLVGRLGGSEVQYKRKSRDGS